MSESAAVVENSGVRKKVPKGSKAQDGKRGRPKSKSDSVAWGNPKEVLLSEIIIDERYQSRSDIPTPTEYRELLESSTDWPFSEPVRLAQIAGKLYLVAGFTRCEAAKLAGREKVLASVAVLTKDKAFELSLGENESHGYRRTNADKAKAVRLAIGKWPNRSASAIAKICKVSHTYVANVVAKLKEAEKVAPAELEAAPEPPPAIESKQAEAQSAETESDYFDSLSYVESSIEHPSELSESNAPDVSASHSQMAINLTEGKRAEARSLVGKLVRILVGLGKDETCKQEIEKILKEIG